jgi:manganese/zinc/iron transport system ATP- binding protein
MQTTAEPQPGTQTALQGERAPALEVHDLTVSYHRKPVLWNIDLAVPEGKLVGIIGPNGAGKSTLIKAVMGLLPLSSGWVQVYGRPVEEMRERIAYVPQRESVDWTFPVTAMDVVLMGRYGKLRWWQRVGKRDRDRARECLEHVGMLPYADRQISNLSGGQQQRVFVARALAQEADVLLLDEPMTGIDASTQEVVMGIIEEQRQQGKIVLLATHDLFAASCACDCLCCVGERAVSFGPTEQMYTEETLTEVFGGPVIILGQQSEPQPAHGYIPGHAVHHEHDHTHEVHG